MATQLLQPQDCLNERFRASPAVYPRRGSSGSHCRNYYNSNYNNHAAASRSYRKPVVRPDQRKKTVVSSGKTEYFASVSKRPSAADDTRVGRSNGLGTEKVTILRRGQSLDSSPVAVRSDVMYAGSACAVSPSPSALPLPSFSTRKQSPAVYDDSATRDLRRLLRLE